MDTMFASRPWTKVPPVSTIPFDDPRPEYVFRLDIFHVFKVGVGRDVVGSLIVLARLGFFDQADDPRNLAMRLRRMHKSFRLWCSACQKTPALRYFSAALFNIKNMQTDFPWSNTKASDTMLLIQYMNWFSGLMLSDLPAHLQQHRGLLQLLRSTTRHGLQLVEVCYTHGLWWHRRCAQSFFLHTMSFLAGYQALARRMLQLRMPGCPIKPKFHALHHLAWEVRAILVTPAPRILNVACFACDMNEDCVGRLCSLALAVDTRSINRRVIQRHFLKLRASLRRMRNYRKSQGLLV